MPWTAWKHREFDWGYEPFQYFAVEYRYANDENHPEEKISWLKRMISACHEQGIHVILDGVFNINYHRESDAKGIPRLLEDIQAYLDAQGEKNFSMTLEHLNASAVEITKKTKATSYWDNALYENCFYSLWWNQIDSKIMDVFNNNRWLDSSDKVATIYLGNHDHSHVNWQAGARENAGALRWYMTQPYVIALLTCPGTPMIQNGRSSARTTGYRKMTKAQVDVCSRVRCTGSFSTTR
jgi:glycosidase